MKKILPVLLLALSSCGKPPPIIALACADPVAGCAMQVGGQSLHLRFSETPRPLRPFDLELTTKAESIEASFQMQGMEMGFNRYRLLPEAGKWRARVILPACIRGRSNWELQLEVKMAGITHRYQLPFRSG